MRSPDFSKPIPSSGTRSSEAQQREALTSNNLLARHLSSGRLLRAPGLYAVVPMVLTLLRRRLIAWWHPI
jgi:hypothetical protein